MVEICGEKMEVYSSDDGIILVAENKIYAYIDGEWYENLECVGGDGLNHYYVTQNKRVIVYSFNQYTCNTINVYESWREMVRDIRDYQYAMVRGGDSESDVEPNEDVLKWLDDLSKGCLGEWDYNNYTCKYYYIPGIMKPRIKELIEKEE